MYIRKALGDISSSWVEQARLAATGQDVSSTPTHEYNVEVSGANAPTDLFKTVKEKRMELVPYFLVGVGLIGLVWGKKWLRMFKSRLRPQLYSME